METLIQFFSEELDFSLDDEAIVLDWILEVIGTEELNAGVINIIFCNDDYLLDLNQRFLERETLTDVIAFDYKEDEEDVSGDIFISIERVNENASQLQQSLEEEVKRVIIHGILHLCGYADKGPDKKAAMTAKEDKYLSLLSL
jgi:probable rRNA maturation factor